VKQKTNRSKRVLRKENLPKFFIKIMFGENGRKWGMYKGKEMTGEGRKRLSVSNTKGKKDGKKKKK